MLKKKGNYRIQYNNNPYIIRTQIVFCIFSRSQQKKAVFVDKYEFKKEFISKSQIRQQNCCNIYFVFLKTDSTQEKQNILWISLHLKL